MSPRFSYLRCFQRILAIASARRYDILLYLESNQKLLQLQLSQIIVVAVYRLNISSSQSLPPYSPYCLIENKLPGVAMLH